MLAFSSTLIEPGQFLVATATDSLGNTSEFSAVSEVLGEVRIEEDLIFQSSIGARGGTTRVSNGACGLNFG